MYGWRGRFGHVCPAIYDTQELEFRQILPEGVMVVTTTLNVQNLVEVEFERAFSIMEQGALILAGKKLEQSSSEGILSSLSRAWGVTER